jgi:hypothetical protein
MAGISEASGQDVGKMMDNWLSKTGHSRRDREGPQGSPEPVLRHRRCYREHSIPFVVIGTKVREC